MVGDPLHATHSCVPGFLSLEAQISSRLQPDSNLQLQAFGDGGAVSDRRHFMEFIDGSGLEFLAHERLCVEPYQTIRGVSVRNFCNQIGARLRSIAELEVGMAKVAVATPVTV